MHERINSKYFLFTERNRRTPHSLKGIVKPITVGFAANAMALIRQIGVWKNPLTKTLPSNGFRVLARTPILSL